MEVMYLFMKVIVQMSKRDVPKRYEKLYKKAMLGRSRKAAMRMFCLECVGYENSEVSLCTDPECPLYPYRPKESGKL